MPDDDQVLSGLIFTGDAEVIPAAQVREQESDEAVQADDEQGDEQ